MDLTQSTFENGKVVRTLQFNSMCSTESYFVTECSAQESTMVAVEEEGEEEAESESWMSLFLVSSLPALSSFPFSNHLL